jgi:hypothetical protein
MAKVQKLFARVKADQKLARMVLFSGREFVKTEFRRVPAGFEEQAKNDDRIDVKLQSVAAEEVEETPTAPQTNPVVERITITDTEDQTPEEGEGFEEGEESDEDGEGEEDAETSEKPKKRRGSTKAK